MKTSYRQLCNSMNYYTIKVNGGMEFSYYGYLDEAIKHADWLRSHNKFPSGDFTNTIEYHGEIVAYEEWKDLGDESVSSDWQHIA